MRANEWMNICENDEGDKIKLKGQCKKKSTFISRLNFYLFNFFCSENVFDNLLNKKFVL